MGRQTWSLNWDGVGPREQREDGVHTLRAQGRINPGQEGEELVFSGLLQSTVRSTGGARCSGLVGD